MVGGGGWLAAAAEGEGAAGPGELLSHAPPWPPLCKECEGVAANRRHDRYHHTASGSPSEGCTAYNIGGTQQPHMPSCVATDAPQLSAVHVRRGEGF